MPGIDFPPLTPPTPEQIADQNARRDLIEGLGKPQLTRQEQAENLAGQPLTVGEAQTVLDAHADGDDITDALAEYRRWNSPAGRREAAADAFDNGRV